MIITAHNELPNLFPQNLESTTSSNNSWPNFGSELVYTQDGAGRYLTFYWQHSELLGLNPENLISELNQHEDFVPVDKVTYLERLHRILTNLVPERIQCWFRYRQELFELELVITPVMPRLGYLATTVLVMGRLLQTKAYTEEVNGSKKTLTQIELTMRWQQHQKLVNKITKNIRRTLDLSVIWQQTVDILGEALKLERCIICPYQPFNSKIKVIAEYKHPEKASMLGSEIDMDVELAFAEAATTLEPIVVELTGSTQFNHQRVLLVATSYQNKANGIVALNVWDECYPLTEGELELIKEVADQLGTAIAHATLYKELEIARQKAEEASRLKTDFLANVSHEIRTPLNGMIGFLKLVLDGMADNLEEQNQFLTEAHQLSIHLLDIMNDILDIAKIEAGKMEVVCNQ